VRPEREPSQYAYPPDPPCLCHGCITGLTVYETYGGVPLPGLDRRPWESDEEWVDRCNDAALVYIAGYEEELRRWRRGPRSSAPPKPPNWSDGHRAPARRGDWNWRDARDDHPYDDWCYCLRCNAGEGAVMGVVRPAY
jgi:hypothetical protein